jgi:hypothetical protein
MAGRTIEVRGEKWSVSPSGRFTQYEKDEFSLRFVRQPAGSAPDRIVRYSPLGAKDRESSFAGLSDGELIQLFLVSQPSWTSAELGYRR